LRHIWRQRSGVEVKYRMRVRQRVAQSGARIGRFQDEEDSGDACFRFALRGAQDLPFWGVTVRNLIFSKKLQVMGSHKKDSLAVCLRTQHETLSELAWGTSTYYHPNRKGLTVGNPPGRGGWHVFGTLDNDGHYCTIDHIHSSGHIFFLPSVVFLSD